MIRRNQWTNGNSDVDFRRKWVEARKRELLALAQRGADPQLWSAGVPDASVGTAERPRTPWIPITLFGFALDEDGPKTVAPQLDEEPGRCAPGDAI